MTQTPSVYLIVCTNLFHQGEHEQYTLTIGMMLGIRVAVGRPQQLDDLTLMDFMQVDKYLFPPKGELPNLVLL